MEIAGRDVNYDLRGTEIPAVILARDTLNKYPSTINLEDTFQREKILSFLFNRYPANKYLVNSESQVDVEYQVKPCEYLLNINKLNKQFFIHVVIENNFEKPFERDIDFLEINYFPSLSEKEFDESDCTRMEFTFLHNEAPESIKAIGDLVKELKQFAIKPQTQGVLHLISQNEDGFILKPFSLEKVEVDLELNYGKDFSELYEYILTKLEDTKKGIVLFHGDAGTGKTRLISYLISQIRLKKVIYLTPDMSNELANPRLISFLLNFPNSILVIEDGENVLKTRKQGANQSIANLLNMTDGLLGECLKYQIICTFNCPLNEIDSALLRKGRLLARHEFKALSIENAQALSNKLGFKTKISKDTTLADIYNQTSKEFKEKENTIGFKV